MPPVSPVEIELYLSFSQHLGPRYEAAGLRVQFHYNQMPGVHFRVPVADEYWEAILRGIQDGMAARFPRHLDYRGLVARDAFSQRAFYRAARSIVEQAYMLATETR